MADSSNSEWLWKPHVSRRAALRAAILGATIPGALYLAKAANSADAADDNIYIPGAPNFLELGHGWPGKEANAGKITYRQWSDALDIVGAGTQPGYRKVKIWDDLYVQGLLNLRAYIVDPEVPRTWTAFLYAKDVNGQSKPFWKDATGTAQPLVARSATLVVAANSASPQSKLGADFVCDGIADEVEINAAIDALPSGGGKVVLTEGTFTLSNTVVLGSTGTTLEGQGYGTLIQFDGTLEPAIGHGGRTVTDARIRNLRIKDTHASASHGGIGIGSDTHIPQRITIDHVEAENCDLRIFCGSHHRIERCYVHDLSSGQDSGISIRAESSTLAYDSIIANNIIENVADMGIACPRTTDSIIVANNRIKNAGQVTDIGHAIDVSRSINVLITGNNIESKRGILSENADAGSVAIAGNIVRGTDHQAGTGIQVWRKTTDEPQADRVLVSGNVVSHTHFGIQVKDEGKVAIVNNLVDDIGQDGITVDVNDSWGTDPDDVLVQGNTVLRWAANNAYSSGIRVAAANAKISDNYLDGASLNNNRGISGVDNPGWILNNVIRNVVNEEIYDIEADVVIRSNFGYVTENSGTATIASGSTYSDVTHGLSTTPNAKDISVTPTNNLGNASKFWISNVGASTFRINVNISPGPTTATFAWHADVL